MGPRGRDSPTRFFPADWKGVMQTDGWDTYAGLAKERPDMVHVGCMAHLRRYFVEAIDAGCLEAKTSLGLISALYHLEHEARDRGLTHEQRGHLRYARSRPILKRLNKHLTQLKGTVLPQSALGKAIAYALNHWAKMVRYAKPGFGHLLIDNNPVENGIRPTKIGAKNWLFVGHPNAGWRSAVIYTITGTCRLLGVDPEAYLRWVLPQLAVATNQSALHLLPQHYAAMA